MTTLVIIPGSPMQSSRIRKWLKRHDFHILDTTGCIMVPLTHGRERRKQLLDYISMQLDKGPEPWMPGNDFMVSIRVYLAVRTYDSGALHEGLKVLG